MPRVGFEPTISAGERPRIYNLDRAATGTGSYVSYCPFYDLELVAQFLCQWEVNCVYI